MTDKHTDDDNDQQDMLEEHDLLDYLTSEHLHSSTFEFEFYAQTSANAITSWINREIINAGKRDHLHHASYP